MMSQEAALANPMDLQSFENYVQDICRSIKQDPYWPELDGHLCSLRELFNSALQSGSVYSHASWLTALTPLMSLNEACRSDEVVLCIAKNFGVTYEYTRLVISRLSPGSREKFAEILSSDPKQSIILPFLHTIGQFGARCKGIEASFAIIFSRFLTLVGEGRFRHQEMRVRNENCLAALKHLNTHLTHCPDNPATFDMLERHSATLKVLFEMPTDQAGSLRGWMGIDLYVALHKVGLGHIIPDQLKPENAGNQYNALLRLNSIGKAPEAEYFNQRFSQYPNNLDPGHLSYAIQNPALSLPLDHLVRGAIPFDVLVSWIKKISAMELPEPHAPQRLTEVFKTLVDHMPVLIDHIIASGVRVPEMMGIEALREAMLSQDIGL
jgi:hypothetical protein